MVVVLKLLRNESPKSDMDLSYQEKAVMLSYNNYRKCTVKLNIKYTPESLIEDNYDRYHKSLPDYHLRIESISSA